MKILTGKQMKRLDQDAIKNYGIPSLLLMENAGRSIAEVMSEAIEDFENTNIVVVAGKGNNGGDGLCTARHLINQEISTEIFLLGEPDKLSEETATQLEILKKSGQEIFIVTSQQNLEELEIALADADVVLDTLLGIGVKGAVRGLLEQAIEAVNTCGAVVVSADLPSGVDADTGHVEGAAVQADLTITMEHPKLGLFLHPGAEYAGEVVVTPIGYPNSLSNELKSKLTLVEEDEVRNWLPSRSLYSYKGSYGKVLLLAGSKGLSGAALLAGEAALRSGAGLVYVGYPENLSQVIENQLWEAVKLPLPEEEGSLCEASVKPVLNFLKQHEIDVIAIGPGLSLRNGTKQFLHQLLPQLDHKLVLDADALNLLANPDGRKLLKKLKNQIILTPHPGELSRLIDEPIEKIEADRVGVAQDAAKQFDTVIVLKGVPTVTALSDSEIFINSTGNSGLATGGSGDVLTGLIAGLVAQGMPVERAASSGVFLHGLFADRLASEIGERAMLPRDLLDIMPEVMSEFE